MNYYNFNTSDYAMFSIGEMQEGSITAEFALGAKTLKRRERQAKIKKLKTNLEKKGKIKGKRYSDKITGKNRLKGSGIAQIKSHVRKTAKGGLALIKGGLRRVKQGTPKIIQAGRQAAVSLGKDAAYIGGAGLGAAKGAAGSAWKVAKNNPRIAGGVAGATALGGVGYGAYRVASGKKRRR